MTPKVTVNRDRELRLLLGDARALQNLAMLAERLGDHELADRFQRAANAVADMAAFLEREATV